MKILVCFILLLSSMFAREWHLERDPFRVSEKYMDQTGKHYLEPKSNYIMFEIKPMGVYYKGKTKEVLLDLGDKGLVSIKEGESVDVDTSDIKNRLKVITIEKTYIIVSVNQGEGIRYEIK